jgi:hypothetical protein
MQLFKTHTGTLYTPGTDNIPLTVQVHCHDVGTSSQLLLCEYQLNDPRFH